MDVRVGLWRKLSTDELMLLNCGVGEDSWESLGLQGDPPIYPKGDQPWDFFGRNDAKAETPVVWPPHVKSWLIGKDSDAGRDWGQEEKGTTEDKMAGWHHWLDGRESEWTLGVGDGQGGLACCDSWGRKESDTTEQLNWTELKSLLIKGSTYKDTTIQENHKGQYDILGWVITEICCHTENWRNMREELLLEPGERLVSGGYLTGATIFSWGWSQPNTSANLSPLARVIISFLIQMELLLNVVRAPVNNHTRTSGTKQEAPLPCVYLAAQSCLPLCDPMDCSPPGLSEPRAKPKVDSAQMQSTRVNL